WSGAAPSPSAWQAAALAAQAEADAAVETIQRRASAREDAALARQVQAAQLRLLRELARHLLAHNPAGGDLNTTLYDLMSGQRADGRIRVAFQRLDGYPTWPDALVAPLRAEVREMTEGQRKAVTLGKALDAALADPRWAAVCAPTGSSSASDR
ncbi:MAG TPA: hypothetical protein VK610_00850, partial [Rhodothermales bacterium]|nr:hypothetical protein [Rhodothermales bacterium]